jgi:TonB family protein
VYVRRQQRLEFGMRFMTKRFGIELSQFATLMLVGLVLGSCVQAQPEQPAAVMNTSLSAQSAVSPQTSVSNAESKIAPTREWAILTPTQGVDFRPYVEQLISHVRDNWFKSMPQDAMMGAKGRVSVIFTIQPDGTLSLEGPAVETSSREKSLNEAAVASIRKSAPFSPLPQTFHGPYVKLRLVFLYNTLPR